MTDRANRFSSHFSYRQSGYPLHHNHNTGHTHGSCKVPVKSTKRHQWGFPVKKRCGRSFCTCPTLHASHTHSSVSINRTRYQGHSQIEVTRRNGKSMHSTGAQRQVLCGEKGSLWSNSTKGNFHSRSARKVTDLCCVVTMGLVVKGRGALFGDGGYPGPARCDAFKC